MKRLNAAAVAVACMLASTTSLYAQVPKLAPTTSDVPSSTADMTKRKGWHVYQTKHAYADLVKRLDAAVAKNKMAVVNAASASDGAKAQGFTIPGNKVVGVFRNDFARRMLTMSIAAGIEAPIRLYLTQNAAGGSTLSYRPPTAVFAPYVTRRTAGLATMAKELDAIFAQIALDAIAN